MKVTEERAREVFERNIALFHDYPHAQGVSLGYFMDRESNETDKMGLTLSVQLVTDPITLSDDQRIPYCLEGVPVQIEFTTSVTRAATQLKVE